MGRTSRKKKNGSRALTGLTSSNGSVSQDEESTVDGDIAIKQQLDMNLTCSDVSAKRKRIKKKHKKPKNKKLKLSQLCQPGDVTRCWPKRLFVFDLNGVLVCRSKQRIPGVSHAFKDCKGLFSYVRPNVRHFLDWLVQERGVAIGIWSSAKKSTIESHVKSLFNGKPELRARLMLVMSQEDCSLSLSPRGRVYQKPLQNLWTKYPEWNEKNTVLFDDTLEKCLENMGNTVILRTYHPQQLHIDHFSEAGAIWSFTDKLTRYDGDDVRTFLSEHGPSLDRIQTQKTDKNSTSILEFEPNVQQLPA